MIGQGSTSKGGFLGLRGSWFSREVRRKQRRVKEDDDSEAIGK